jgi:hypothetical protein
MESPQLYDHNDIIMSYKRVPGHLRCHCQKRKNSDTWTPEVSVLKKEKLGHLDTWTPGHLRCSYRTPEVSLPKKEKCGHLDT